MASDERPHGRGGARDREPISMKHILEALGRVDGESYVIRNEDNVFRS